MNVVLQRKRITSLNFLCSRKMALLLNFHCRIPTDVQFHQIAVNKKRNCPAKKLQIRIIQPSVPCWYFQTEKSIVCEVTPTTDFNFFSPIFVSFLFFLLFISVLKVNFSRRNMFFFSSRNMSKIHHILIMDTKKV